MKEKTYRRGEYVVLLASCDGGNIWKDEMPINYIFKLKNDYNKFNFSIELDIQGSTSNGWTIGNSDYYNKLKIRLATLSEKQAYIKNNGPLHIDDVKAQVDEYEMY